MKIVDCFTFYNELDMLYYRLSMLYDIVDYFVLVEAKLTHVGKPKPLYYEENKKRFEKFADKIIRVVDDQLIENVHDAWINENHQRNFIDEGLKKLNLQPNDKIIVADLDEIPDPTSLKKIKDSKLDFLYLRFKQDFYYYNLTLKSVSATWEASKIASYEYYVNHFKRKPHDFRMGCAPGQVVPGGWHLSYFGDPKFIRNKIENFGHQEYNNEKYKNEDEIADKIKNKTDLFSRPTETWKYIPISENPYLPPQYETYLSAFLG